MSEPHIIINGALLTEGQSMAVRVAIEAFATQLAELGSLGDDEHGRLMLAAYLERISELRKLMGVTT